MGGKFHVNNFSINYDIIYKLIKIICFIFIHTDDFKIFKLFLIIDNLLNLGFLEINDFIFKK